LTCREASSASGSFQDLGSFVFGDHPLHLHQQVSFRRVDARDVVEENDLHAMLLEFFQKHDLVRIFPGQAIRRQHVKPIDGAVVRQITQALEGGALHQAAAEPFVQQAEFGFDLAAIRGNALSQRCHLALNGHLLGLSLGANTGIQGDANGLVHDVKHSLPLRAKSVVDQRIACCNRLSPWSFGDDLPAKSAGKPGTTIVPQGDGIRKPFEPVVRAIFGRPP
jgi:hypothetical protein